MRSVLIALSASLFTTAAHADVMGTIQRGLDGVSGYLPDNITCGAILTWRVDLEAGQDYAFHSFFDRQGTATLHNPSGATIMTFLVIPSSGDFSTGHEAHASVTGTYFLDIQVGPTNCGSDGNRYWLSYQYDCLGGRRTQCTLPAGTTRKSYISFPGEWDWWKTTLKVGKSYDIATDIGLSRIVVRDAQGKPIVSADHNAATGSPPVIRGFRPHATGTYFIDVEGETNDEGNYWGSYAVSLKAR